jgi:23S rRNA pseudouridine1911/1915/1917 synthase
VTVYPVNSVVTTHSSPIPLSVASSDAGKRLDHFLQEKLPQYTRSRLQSWIKDGLVTVNGTAAKASLTLRGGEQIGVTPGELPPLKASPENLPLDILYEDASVIAVNKPSGLIVHAGAGAHSGTLVNRLVHHFQKLSQVGGDLRPGIVHRLDKGTSGVLLVARDDAAHQALAQQFSGRTVEKIYLALVHGRMENDTGRITTPIERDPVRRIRMSARTGTGRSALTEFRVLQRFDNFTYLEVRIGTGRTHQIRVHLSSIGHPVAGDRLYGAPPAERVFLHAHRITFTSPATHQRVSVEAPLPADLRAWLASLS